MASYTYKPPNSSSNVSKSSGAYKSPTYRQPTYKTPIYKSPSANASKKTTSGWPSQGRKGSAKEPPSSSNQGKSAMEGAGVGLATTKIKYPQHIGGASVGGGAKSVIARQQLKNVLSVTEQANPLVDSLRKTGELPPNYMTQDVAKAHGWKHGKAIDNFVPGGQIGGAQYENRLFEKGAVKKAFKDGSFKETWKNRNTVLPWDSWKEADVGLSGKMTRAKQPGNRLLYSKAGEMYVSTDHYKSFDHIGNYLDDGTKNAGAVAKGTSGVHPNIGKAAKVGGKALAVAGVAMDAKELYDSYQADGGKIGENTVTSAGGIAGSWGGAALGAKGGAMGGAALGTMICPGIGTAVGGFIGGLAGGILGGLGGRWAGEKIADAAYDETVSN